MLIPTILYKNKHSGLPSDITEEGITNRFLEAGSILSSTVIRQRK